VTVAQQRVLKELAACRTAVLGGHLQECLQCGYQQPSYNSCRNRHCPKCQAAARAAWLEDRAAELLPVPYFHVVFTLPALLGPLALQNQKVVYGLLFACAAETLREVAADPKHLGAQVGFLAVLHTWGQNLQFHPHLHCVVPGGGLSPDRTAWVACRPNFFLPVRVLSRVFRGKFLERLQQAFARGQLSFHGTQTACPQAAFAQVVRQAYATDWVVYAKPPFGGPEQVLKYLARYTHRVAISNDRLLDLQDGQVTFRWKNYARRSRWQTLTLPAEEFIRRFLLHVLPPGFVRIRYYGFLSQGQRTERLALCRRLLVVPAPAEAEPNAVAADAPAATATPPAACPRCGHGPLRVVAREPRPSVADICWGWDWDTC
jgi:putative transposase/transposase-like zinc-binding protein